MRTAPEGMMLGIFLELCDMCKRLITLVKAQQIELELLDANSDLLEQWERETQSIEDMLKKIEH